MKKKQPPKKAARAIQRKPTVTRTQASPTEAPIVIVAQTESVQPPKPAAPRRAAGRLHRSTLTAAGLRGRDLVRFLRIHAKRPYGRRGEEAIRLLAVEVGHLGNVELNARAGAEGSR